MVARDLAALRDTITGLDETLIRTLEKRLKIAEQIGKIKRQKGLPLTDPAREKELLTVLKKSAKSSLFKSQIEPLYKVIFEMSKAQQRAVKKPFTAPVSIGIIGYGRFGQLLADIFRTHWQGARILVFSKTQAADHVLFFPLEAISQCDIVLPCVPISSLKNTLQEIAPLLKDGATVIDVCSVKVAPVEWMKRIVKQKAGIIATHPMFGPDSTRQGKQLAGLNMMLYNVSAKKSIYDLWKSFWDFLEMHTVEITPREHDRFAAYTINYNHLIGRIGEKIGIRETPIDTAGFSVIYQALTYVVNDSWQLFLDMQRYNPYAGEMRKKIARALREIEEEIKQSGRKKLISKNATVN